MKPATYFFRLVLFTFIFKTSLAQAQLKDNTREIAFFDLNECIRYAHQNSESLRKVNLDAQIAKANVKEIKAIGLPQVNLQGQFVNNIRVQQTILPDGTLFGGPPGPIAVAFQPHYIGAGSIQISQLLFDASYLIGLKAARTLEQLTTKQVQLNKQTIAENVSKAYYTVLLNQERVGLLDKNLQRLDSLIKDTKALFKNGFVEKIDLDRLEVAYNNLKIEKQKIDRLIDFARKALKFQMNMPLNDSLALKGSIADIKLEEGILQETADYTKRLEYSLLSTQRTLLNLDVKNKKSTILPRLFFVWNTGANTGMNNLDNFLKFGKVNGRPVWFEYHFFALSASWNLFDGFRRKYATQKAMLEVQKVEQDMKILKQATDFQVENARTTLINSLADLEVQKRNMELASEVARVAKIKYQSGVGTNLEIINAETSFKEAETNYYTALYNAIIAKIDLDVALGKMANYGKD
ncbi:MAG: TolC family protein [Microscillaceae bacterium]|nr:TolC family protein [Microscillaceae bacterium]MDW8461310.1 TolC family protein [Cytophagales bacterium]